VCRIVAIRGQTPGLIPYRDGPSPVSEYDCLHFRLGQSLGNDGTREELMRPAGLAPPSEAVPPGQAAKIGATKKSYGRDFGVSGARILPK
jgi:hypothetical protein